LSELILDVRGHADVVLEHGHGPLGQVPVPVVPKDQGSNPVHELGVQVDDPSPVHHGGDPAPGIQDGHGVFLGHDRVQPVFSGGPGPGRLLDLDEAPIGQIRVDFEELLPGDEPGTADRPAPLHGQAGDVTAHGLHLRALHAHQVVQAEAGPDRLHLCPALDLD